MIKGILFDMDGVLLDTERASAMAVDLALQRMGYKLPGEVLGKLPGANEAFTKHFISKYIGVPLDYKGFQAYYYEENERLLARQGGIALKNGVQKTLEWISSKGIPMCVASSTRIDTVEKNLSETGIRHFFAAAIGGDMVKNSKPAPDIFLAAAKAIDVPPQNCIAVEDSFNGVHSASAAGCVTVMIPDCTPPNDDMENTATAILAGMEDLPGFIACRNPQNLL